MESVAGADYLSANYQKLMRISEAMRYYAAPFVFAGDWNTTPQDLEALGFLQVMPAAIVAPSQGTCRSAVSGTYRVIDYWLTTPGFVRACGKPRVLDRWTARPHYP
eukprot:6419533-Pyramimonas_sp.AAC.1